MSDMEKAMSQMLADMTPKKLPTNEEIFGKGAEMGDAKAMGFTDLLDSMTPKKLPTNEEIFGQLAELDTTAFDELLKMITPQKLMSYDDLAKMFGMKL